MKRKAAAPTTDDTFCDTMDKGRVRRFVFTVNNWTAKEREDIIANCDGGKIKWMIVAKETGTRNGTPHLQGACLLKVQTSFGTISKWPGFARAWMQVMRGEPQLSLDYCTKEDAGAFIFGDLPKPGTRTDLVESIAKIVGGASMVDLANSEDIRDQMNVVKYYNGFKVLQNLRVKDRTSFPYVFWLYGATGTHKTRAAVSASRKICSKAPYMSNAGGMKWFDGYEGDQCAVIDDFRAKGVSFGDFLRLTDCYPYRVEYKGGYVNWVAEWIFITTPDAVDVTFATRKEHKPEDLNQLHRRLTGGTFFFPDDKKKFVDRVKKLIREPEVFPDEEDMFKSSEEEEVVDLTVMSFHDQVHSPCSSDLDV